MAQVVAAGDPRMRPLLVATLRSAGIAVVPCDTLYGIVGIVPEAEERIRSAKGRVEEKPFIRLIAHPGWLRDFASVRPPRAILAYWPGPLTLVLPARGGGTVAVRLPDDDFLRSLMRELGKPLYSTSVNRAGEEPLCAVRDIVAAFGERVDLVVDAGDRPVARPSTIVDLTVRPARVLRQGALRLPESLLAGLERSG